MLGTLLAYAPAILAQEVELNGAVHDSSGAVVPKAVVRAVNKTAGLARSVRTESSGRYILPSLAPGIYDIEASANGFKKATHTDLTLHVAQKTTQDFVLEVGEMRSRGA
jgi:hypothetical protein